MHAMRPRSVAKLTESGVDARRPRLRLRDARVQRYRECKEDAVTMGWCREQFSLVLTVALCGGIALGRAAADEPKAAKSAAAEDVRGILEPIREKAGLTALAAVVTRGRDVVAQGVCGVRKAGTDTAATLDDRWHLGSCTKALTATLLAVLVEEGKLRWDSTLGEVFPDVPKHEKWTGVSLEQLLAHRAGVPARLDPKGEWVEVYMRRGTPREQRAAVVRGTLSQAPQSEPGTSYAYSNGGVAIAGAMAERVADAPWEDLIRARVFAPLGMTSTGFGSPGSPDAVDQPWGHRPDGTPDRADNPAATAPAGLVHASLRDWASFVAVHTGGWREDRGEACRGCSHRKRSRRCTCRSKARARRTGSVGRSASAIPRAARAGAGRCCSTRAATGSGTRSCGRRRSGTWRCSSYAIRAGTSLRRRATTCRRR
jgi:CubicO group peptidase (beta-lactamase class C family)